MQTATLLDAPFDRRWRVCVGLVLALLLISFSAPRSAAANPELVQASPADLLRRATQLNIARSLAWRRLLHYRPNALGRPVSEVDGHAFFLAANGQSSPEDELAATLSAFFAPVQPGHEDEHALCRFPARRQLLDERLHFEGALRTPNCPKLARYLAEMDTASVTVVYSANFLNNPASAFGHTFLRFKKRATPPDERLDHGADYMADTDTENPFLYAFKGLTGLFPGVFRVHSFESKVLEYSNAEARDLWEYDLSLSSAEVRLLTLHVWELSATTIDYYYLSENCSYQVVAALEAAAPRIDLIAHLKTVVLPGDTVKALFRVPGLVRATDYRPSMRSQYRAQVCRLDPEQRELVQRLTEDPQTPLPRRFSLADSVEVLDTAVFVLDARSARSLEAPRDVRVDALRAALAQRRARLSASLPPPTPGAPPYEKAPEHAHGSMRVTLGTGVTSQYGSSFSTLGYRLALHDLTDPPDGAPELSQVQFLDARLRYDAGERALTLERLTFAELVALNPITLYEHALSWRARGFGMRLHDRACPDCFAHGLDFALGATLASEDEHSAFFLMADVYAAFSGRLDGIDGSFVRVGLGPYAGLRARLPGASVALLTANWAYLPGQHLHGTYDIRATLRSALSKDVAVGFEGALQPSSAEAQFASYLYF